MSNSVKILLLIVGTFQNIETMKYILFTHIKEEYIIKLLIVRKGISARKKYRSNLHFALLQLWRISLCRYHNIIYSKNFPKVK